MDAALGQNFDFFIHGRVIFWRLGSYFELASGRTHEIVVGTILPRRIFNPD